MPSTASETFYDLAVRSLEEQEREVTSLRSRTGTLAAAAAVTATLLTRSLFVDQHPDGWIEWASASVGLVALGAVLFASVYLLRSHDMAFTADAAIIREEAETDGKLEDVVLLQLRLAQSLAAMHAQNRVVVEKLKTVFAAALTALVAETLGLGLGAALV
jgi:hypothetical protein